MIFFLSLSLSVYVCVCERERGVCERVRVCVCFSIYLSCQSDFVCACVRSLLSFVIPVCHRFASIGFSKKIRTKTSKQQKLKFDSSQYLFSQEQKTKQNK